MPRIALWIMTEVAIIGADIQEACICPSHCKFIAHNVTTLCLLSSPMSWNPVKLRVRLSQRVLLTRSSSSLSCLSAYHFKA